MHKETRRLNQKMLRADSLAWQVGRIKALVDNSIDPTKDLEFIIDSYKHDQGFINQAKSGAEFTENQIRNGDLVESDRIIRISPDFEVRIKE